MINYSYYNIKFKPHPVEQWIVVEGEIRNESPRNYHTAVFRLKLFAGQECLGAGVVKMHGFHAKATKSFEVLVEGVHKDTMSKIHHCEISLEAVY
jgi:hypothetical protein